MVPYHNNNNNEENVVVEPFIAKTDTTMSGVKAYSSNPNHFNVSSGDSAITAKSLAAKIKGNTTSTTAFTNGSVTQSVTILSSSDSSTVAAVHSTIPTKSVLHQKLTQCTRGSDRRNLLRTLKNPTEFPSSHVMKGVVVEDIAMAEREGARERGVLNGVKFFQVKSEPKDENEPLDSYFLQTLREICGHLCDMDGVLDIDPMALYGGLLLRLSRSVSENDALDIITPWLALDDLIVLPLKRRHHCASTNNTGGKESLKLAQPIDVELFVEAGDVHAKVTMRHEFGLYRRSDLHSRGVNEHRLSEWSKLLSRDAPMTSIQNKFLRDPAFTNIKPWVFLDADVIERINFGSGSNVRLLRVSVPDKKNSGYV